jgi:hypothetical protein
MAADDSTVLADLDLAPKEASAAAWRGEASDVHRRSHTRRVPRVTPYLHVDGASAAIDFYTDVLGATERMRMPGDTPDKTGHAELQLGDSVIMLADEFPAIGTVPIHCSQSPGVRDRGTTGRRARPECVARSTRRSQHTPEGRARWSLR